jgi:hypothetical protein
MVNMIEEAFDISNSRSLFLSALLITFGEAKVRQGEK